MLKSTVGATGTGGRLYGGLLRHVRSFVIRSSVSVTSAACIHFER